MKTGCQLSFDTFFDKKLLNFENVLAMAGLIDCLMMAPHDNLIL